MPWAGRCSCFPAGATIQPYGSDQAEIEGRLIEELHAAKAAFDSSSVQFKRILEECQEENKPSGESDLPSSGGRLPVEETLRIHRDAIAGYRQALENLNNFIVYGRLPKPP
jgi:hypothetical protein